jgi:D-alanyl-D-alanine carboxypeptidase (penicillin-binding protein 5/6)
VSRARASARGPAPPRSAAVAAAPPSARRAARSTRPERDRDRGLHGAVACARNADERRSIASTTKLMTALLTLERAKLSDTFTAARLLPVAAESQIGSSRASG